MDGYRAAAGDRAEWRLGYLSDDEIDRALGETTVALFPYRPEIDQSGALMRALGAGVPAVVYDVGGLGEPVRRFGAGRVVPPGDVEALTEAARRLLDDPDALEEARAGRSARAKRADLGCGGPRSPRGLPGARVSRGRFADLIRRQLDLFEREQRGADRRL